MFTQRILTIILSGGFSVVLLPLLAQASVAPPLHGVLPERAVSRSFSGTITAIGSTSFTIMPKATNGVSNPSQVTITVGDSTKIVMRGDQDATLSNLAVGYTVLITTHRASDASLETLVMVNPKDAPRQGT